MPADDPGIKRVLKRYRKGEDFSESSLVIDEVPLARLQEACRCSSDDLLQGPTEIDGYAGVCIKNLIGVDFDFGQFDYFLHAYIRREFAETYYDAPTPGLIPAPEDGPPNKIPHSEGTRWASARPKNGQENYVAVEKE